MSKVALTSDQLKKSLGEMGCCLGLLSHMR